MAADVSTRTEHAPESGRGGVRTQDPTIIFLHIGKTAGSTLREVLSRQFPRREVFTVVARRRPREETLRDFAALPVETRLGPRLIMGHTVFGLHEAVPRACTYITLVRDPVTLVASQHSFVCRTPGHRHHELARGSSLTEYITSGIALEVDNSQTRAISGDLSTPFGACSVEMLERAKANLELQFRVVGLRERFDESLVLLKRRFGWRNVHYVSANVARRRQELSTGERRLIEEQNHLDIQLYEFVASRFAEEVADERGFADEVRRFRRWNALYRPIGVTGKAWRRVGGQVGIA